jgi:hypothetical protein
MSGNLSENNGEAVPENICPKIISYPLTRLASLLNFKAIGDTKSHAQNAI